MAVRMVRSLAGPTLIGRDFGSVSPAKPIGYPDRSPRSVSARAACPSSSTTSTSASGRSSPSTASSFTVEPGRIFGLLGANGAGKTTAMRIVLDILRADAGRVTWKGTENTALPRRTWGYLPEERGLYPKMKVGEQLRFFAALYGVPTARRRREINDWLERFRIPDYLDRKVEELSKGNQQKIQFIAAILHDPEVLIMDEPFTGLDPVNVRAPQGGLPRDEGRGKTLIFSTHQMETVEELCESIAIVDRGRVIVSGPCGT